MKDLAFPILILTLTVIASPAAFAQADNEIQVYASDCVGAGMTIFELHSIYTFQGSKELSDPKQAHWENETLEITHGFGDNFEVGLYTFTGISPDGRYEYLGNQIRPRVTAPPQWQLPFGLSVSGEFGFIRPDVASDFILQGELRPIIDKTWGPWYAALNTNVGFVFTGDEREAAFEPQWKIVYTIRNRMGVGAEYYSNLGSFGAFEPIRREEHLIGPAIDLYLRDDIEINVGFLQGLTDYSNQQIVKVILGKRFGK